MLKLVKLKTESKARLNLLRRYGMPGDVSKIRPFDPSFHTLTAKWEPEGYRSLRVKKARQLQALNDIYENPVGRSYVYVIASNPNETKGKLVAAMLMNRALDVGGTNRGRPAWHRVYGTYNDPLRDAAIRTEKEALSMLIISNVTTDSTNTKMELVRDLLDIYDDRPRILVVTGTDPLTFMHQRLKLPVTYCLNLSTSHRVTL